MPDSRLFWSLDFISGYFQILLAEESQQYTAFVTPFIKFGYRRLPQGFNDSGDAFGYLMDDIVKEIPRVVKSVNDLLGQCRTIQECWDTLSEVLYRVIQKNMVVCPKKFQIGTTFSYGGFVLEVKEGCPIKILLDESRLKELLEPAPPSSKTELHIFFDL